MKLGCHIYLIPDLWRDWMAHLWRLSSPLFSQMYIAVRKAVMRDVSDTSGGCL